MLLKTFSVLHLLIFSIILSSCAPNGAQKVPEKPNVLFIIADDYGYHDLSSRGSNYYETPNLDRLASRSMIFTNGYTAGRVCSPSRASVMSGKSPARHGITDWIGAKEGKDWRKQGRHSKLLPPDYVHHLPFDYTVLPEAMKQEGYQTFFVGKWHLGGEKQGSLPTDHGFDINVGGGAKGSPYNGRYFSPFDNPRMEDRPKEHQDGLSLKPLLEGDSIADRPLFWHYPHYGNQGGRPSSIVREGHWKLIRYHVDSSEVLYDLNADSMEVERTNVYKEHPDVARRLSSELTDYLDKTGAKFPTKDPEYDPEVETKYLNRIKNNLLPRLEKERMEFLSPDYDPGNDWWGSEVEK